MSKRYYIVTANSSEPEINYSKENNTLTFSKARCKWDYAEKVQGCIDCKEQKQINGKPIFKIIESDYQYGKPSKFLNFNVTVALYLMNFIMIIGFIWPNFSNSKNILSEISGDAATITGLILAFVNLGPVKKKISKYIVFGLKINRKYLALNSIGISYIIAGLMYATGHSTPISIGLSLIAFVLSWALF